MTSVRLRQLNAYPEFQNQTDIDNIIDYVRAKEHNEEEKVPFFDELSAVKKRRFVAKFGNHFVLKEDVLYYQPEQRISIQVAKPANHKNILKDLYNNDAVGMGTGINNFYAKVCARYLGIRKQECIDFLRNQGNYQLPQPYVKHVNHPILAKCPNERWGVDILDLSFYGKKNGRAQTHNDAGRARYVLVAVDYFSKKVWTNVLKSPTVTPIATKAAMKRIFYESQTLPHIIQTDNGPADFGNEEFSGFLRRRLIIHVKTLPNNPQSNGLVERMNRTLRMKIRAGFAKHNNLEWWVHLPDYVKNINGNKQLHSKYTADELWKRGYHPLPEQHVIHFERKPSDENSAAEIRNTTEARLIKNANEQLKSTFPEHIYQVGDRVRVRNFRMNSKFREVYKNSLTKKQIAIFYSPEVYAVRQVFSAPEPPEYNQAAPNAARLWNARNNQYYLTKPNGQRVDDRNGTGRKFFGTDLLRVPDLNVPPKIPTSSRANIINSFKPYPYH
jgi:transposase InsO family protein